MGASIIGLVVLLSPNSELFGAWIHKDIQPSPAPRDRIATLNDRLENGAVKLVFQPASGYLRSVLEKLDIMVESQVMVFSKTSFQAKLISPENPRALYFTDDIVIGWVRGSSLIEAAPIDPGKGVVFYTLDQSSADKPRFQRNDSCNSCHQSHRTQGVPGLFVLSSNPYLESNEVDSDSTVTDQRTPLTQRWGGWYVSGRSNRFRHLGNRIGQGWLESLYDQFYTSGYLTEYSDIVALMALEHQTQMSNLISRLDSETHFAGGLPTPARDTVNSLVDYLLFVDEASLPSRIIGTSGYAEKFADLGPRDRKGRSLRQFDLNHRLLKYPCSYMIYSDAFNALPSVAKDAIYARMWQILTGGEKHPRYTRLSTADRQAILEILRDTKNDLPRYFKPLS
jgi:hypothetical protein